jgi:SAM-dependent methyltransferase
MYFMSSPFPPDLAPEPTGGLGSGPMTSGPGADRHGTVRARTPMPGDPHGDARDRRPAPAGGPGGPGALKLYAELASWWPLLSPPSHYAEEAAVYERILSTACERPPRTLLELGSGGGHSASHLKARFELVLVDRSPGMLAMSRALNPECEHVQGDMRTVRLGREFDAVFVHDAICYMTSEAELRSAMETAFVHCRPGGAALFAPDEVRETFQPRTDHGGDDGGGRGLRYLEWHWDPDPDDTTTLTDMAYLLRERDGSLRVEWDRHVAGLFPRAVWLRLLEEVGFRAERVPYDLSDVEPGTLELFVGRKPGSSCPGRT